MTKKNYLVISGLLSFGFLRNGLFPFFTQEILLFFMIVWIGWGFFYFKGYGFLYNTKNQIVSFAFLLLFFLSSLSPVFEWNQTLISTCIAMRANIVVLFLLTLLKISPTEDDFFESFRFLGGLALAMSIIAFFFPNLFLDADVINRILLRQKYGSSDLLIVWPGSAAAVIYFYMLVQRVVERHNLNDFGWMTLFMAYIFLMQNRSTLIGTVPFYIYAIFKSEIKYKKWILLCLLFLVGGYVVTIFKELIEETQSQLSDSKYNRWQAVQFYLLEHDNNLYTILFGNGVPSAGSSFLKYIQHAQYTRLAILSDIGMLGSYYFYGLITVGTIYYFVLRGIFDKRMPRYLRYYCCWVILVPTIHSFCQGLDYGSTVKLILIIYWVMYYSNPYHSDSSYIIERRAI